jgi:hypothetical protein
MTLPYAHTSSGEKAQQEVRRILRGFGCESVGFMEEYDTSTLILAFTWRGRKVILKASAQGWANAFLKENPWTRARKTSRQEYEQRALKQGLIAVNSILRDWVKGQITAVETGILTFEHVFAPYMLTNDGTPAIEVLRAQLSLPAPDDNE